MWAALLLIGIVAVGFVVFTGAPYVPSKPSEVRRALTDLYPLNKKDVLVDIGSGDGIVLRIASGLGVGRAVGYEIHPVLVLVSRLWSRNDARVETRLANFWRKNLPDDTTVVYTFGDSRDIRKMYARVESEATRLGRTLAFVTYGFEVPGLQPNKTVGAHHLYKVKALHNR